MDAVLNCEYKVSIIIAILIVYYEQFRISLTIGAFVNTGSGSRTFAVRLCTSYCKKNRETGSN